MLDLNEGLDLGDDWIDEHALPEHLPQRQAGPATEVWDEERNRRFQSQIHIIRLLQHDAKIPAALMELSGGVREVISTGLAEIPPSRAVDRMDWLRKIATPSFWSLPASIEEDIKRGGDLSLFAKGKMERVEKRVWLRISQLEAMGHGDGNEARGLRLLDMQRQLRARVLGYHPMASIPSTDSIRFLVGRDPPRKHVMPHMIETRDKWEMEKLEMQIADRVQKSSLFIENVIKHHDDFKGYYKDRKELMKKICKEIAKRLKEKEREKLRQSEKEKKDRLQALKSDNIAAYRKHIQDSKNERMKTVVARMDEYMVKLGANIGKLTKEVDHGDDHEVQTRSSALNDYTFELPINEKISGQASIMGNEHLKLKPYQVEGVNWLVNLYNNHLSGILADEMGLGKTIQVIGMITHLMESKGNNGPYMVIAPLSTISNWQNEFERWAPGVVTYVYRGNPQERKEIFITCLKEGQFNVLIIQFELVMDKNDSKRLKQIDWSYVIVDEGHRLKNRESKLFSCLTGKNGYRAKNRVILSGTPLQNEIHELWSLLNFLLPEVFETNEDFEEWFTKPFKTDDADIEVVDEEKEFLIKCLHAVLRPFMTRRLKADLAEVMQLPEARENILQCGMSSLQKVLYLQTENHVLMTQTSDGGTKQTKMSNRIAQLRKVCNHPFIFEEYDMGDDYLVRSCGKFELLDRILPKLKIAGHRVLIYSQMVKLLHLLGRYCRYKGYEHMTLSGESASDDRIDMMKRWNAKDSKYFVFMLSTRAGGQGINLQTADTVIIYDSDWNPMMDEQAKARVHRLGQTKQCLVLRLVTPNTVEEKVTQRAEERLRNEDLAIETGKFNLRTDVSDTHELLRVKLKEDFTDKMEQAKQLTHTNEEVNELIARTDEEIEWFHRIDREQAAQENIDIISGAIEPPLPRLMTDDEVPSWLLGEAIFMDDKVFVLSEETSADMADGQNLGVVVGVPNVQQPMFQVKMLTGLVRFYPRTQIRLHRDETQDRFREDMGYGRGQRERKEVDRTSTIDWSQMSDKQFNKRMRGETDSDDDKKKKKRKKTAVAESSSPHESSYTSNIMSSASGQGPNHSSKSFPLFKPEDVSRFEEPSSEFGDGNEWLEMSTDNDEASSFSLDIGALPSHIMPVDQNDVWGNSGIALANTMSQGIDGKNGESSKYVNQGLFGRNGVLPPWKGGRAKDWIRGRKVVFLVEGRRVEGPHSKHIPH